VQKLTVPDYTFPPAAQLVQFRMRSIAGSSLANMFPTLRGAGGTAREAAARFVEAHTSDLCSHKFNLQISNFHLLSLQALRAGRHGTGFTPARVMLGEGRTDRGPLHIEDCTVHSTDCTLYILYPTVY
jgi:hypothetical protein